MMSGYRPSLLCLLLLLIVWESAAQTLEVRLVNGQTSNEGRVEIYFPSYGWGTLCDQNWSIDEARVVCRQLGLPPAAKAHRGAYFGQGRGLVFIDDIECQGFESNIYQCLTGNSWPFNVCKHYDDVGVTCGAKGISSVIPIVLGGVVGFILLR